MWAEIFIGVITVVTFLYVPGLFFWRGMRFSLALAFCCAPLYSMFAYAALPVVYAQLGIHCGLLNMLAPTFLVALGVFGISSLRRGKESNLLSFAPEPPMYRDEDHLSFDLAMPLLYAGVAAVVCGITFTCNLTTSEAFASQIDNQINLNVVRAFLDSGQWSTLNVSSYLAAPKSAIPLQELVSGGGFYPAAWYDLVALTSLSTASSVTTASNCVGVSFCIVVLPIGTFALLRALFPNKRRIIQVGAFATSMFSTWPWVFIVKGPCYPNLLGMSLMTCLLAAIIVFVESGRMRKMVLTLIATIAVGFLVLAISHPNTLFTAYVFLAAYGAHRVNRRVTRTNLDGAKKVCARLAALAVFWAAIAAVWRLCYSLGPLQDLLSHQWTENTDFAKALVSLLSLRLIVGGTQFIVVFLVLIGTIRCLHEKRFWLLGIPAFFGLCFLACRCGWEPLKYWLAAPWFMVPYRIAANISLFCIPIAALGLDSVFAFVDSRQLAHDDAKPQLIHRLWTPQTVLAALFVLAILPNIPTPFANKTIETSFGRVQSSIHKLYDPKKPQKVFSAKELSFVRKVKDAIPEDALVINVPNDGSVWAYGVKELNTYYRDVSAANHTAESVLIRKHLSEYATNEDVRKAVQATGAQYVLLLDKGVSYDDGVWLPQYKKRHVKEWKGISSIRDDTPGFEIVLEEDKDLRLYKIVL